MVTRSRAKNTRKAILFQRLSPKRKIRWGRIFAGLLASSLCRFWHDFYVPKKAIQMRIQINLPMLGQLK